MSLADVARTALAMPEATEGVRWGTRCWSVRGKAFVWERPFSKADLRRFGDDRPPTGTIVAARVDDLGEKEVVLAARPTSFFTIPHFDEYAAVLIQLSTVGERPLQEAIVDAWLATAPRSLAKAYTDRAAGDRT